MKHALYLAFSRFWVTVLNSTHSWKQSSRNRLANWLGAIAWVVLPKRRHIALTNLRLCFPELDEKERKALAKRVFTNLMRAALDHSVLWVGSKEDVEKMVRIEGREILESSNYRPLIVVAPHFMALDAGGIAINTFLKGASLYQEQSNPVWDEWALKGRKRFSDPILIAKSSGNDLRPVIRALRNHIPFYYLPDMDHGARNSIFVPFFDVPAATLPMVSRLAKVTKAYVVWGIAEMTETGCVMHISKPIANFPSNDYVADTARLNKELEGFIRQYPDQYLWTHRRFKTRPEGEPPVY